MSWRAAAYVKELTFTPCGEMITRSEKLVALCLADAHQDKSDAYTYPAVATLARETLTDERTCRRLLSSLARKGVIEILRPMNQGRSHVNCYRFPELDGVRDEQSKGGHNAPLFLRERGAKGGQKGDKKPVALKEEQEPEPKTKTPPASPTLRAGEGRQEKRKLRADRDPAIRPHAQLAMRECGCSDGKVRRAIAAQMRLELDDGADLADVAHRMASAWRELRESLHLLRHGWGAVAFFGEGHWRDQGSWPWDQAKLQLQRQANVGVWRPQ
jgi:hypothetical protein